MQHGHLLLIKTQKIATIISGCLLRDFKCFSRLRITGPPSTSRFIDKDGEIVDHMLNIAHYKWSERNTDWCSMKWFLIDDSNIIIISTYSRIKIVHLCVIARTLQQKFSNFPTLSSLYTDHYNGIVVHRNFKPNAARQSIQLNQTRFLNRHIQKRETFISV